MLYNMLVGMARGLLQAIGPVIVDKIWGPGGYKTHQGWGLSHSLLIVLWISAVIIAALPLEKTGLLLFIGCLVYIVAYPGFVFYQWQKATPIREAAKAEAQAQALAQARAERRKEYE